MVMIGWEQAGIGIHLTLAVPLTPRRPVTGLVTWGFYTGQGHALPQDLCILLHGCAVKWHLQGLHAV